MASKPDAASRSWRKLREEPAARRPKTMRPTCTAFPIPSLQDSWLSAVPQATGKLGHVAAIPFREATENLQIARLGFGYVAQVNGYCWPRGPNSWFEKKFLPRHSQRRRVRKRRLAAYP